jgi:ubiquinone/menaquinone biosynthesis C-methylase UbiE
MPMNERPSTYFMYDHRHGQEEVRRLTLQDQMMTEAMGGVLPEQADPSVFHRVLDVGCGTGGWVIEAAKQYPTMRLVGIDISNGMIESANQQAKANKVSSQIEFQIMDALRQLAFPSDSFDLVNLRFGVSFIRKWEWPNVIGEMLRVTRPGGVVRITDSEIVQASNSLALKAFQRMILCALNRAGHLWDDEETGLIAHLAPLLKRYGAREVQTQAYVATYQSGTKAGDAYVEDVCSAMKTLKPFIQKWEYASRDYEEVCRMARTQMKRPDFYAVWQLLTAWGKKQ